MADGQAARLDSAQLGRWLDAHGAPDTAGHGEQPVLEPLSGGSQNTLYRVRRGEATMVLRMPGARADSARIDWLRRNRPAHYTPGIMHGDYQFANVMYAHGAPAKLVAIIDWEMTTIGDPLLDLAWVLLGYDGENPRTQGYYADLAGMPTRSELLERYEQVSGLSTENIDYCLVLANWKLGIVLEKTYAASVTGDRVDPKIAAAMGPMIPQLSAPQPNSPVLCRARGADMGYADSLFDLTDRVVLVTGGSRGLGREMALAAARCGADVVIASRKLEACQATAVEIEAETGRSALPHAVHVGRWDQLDGLVEAAYERFGRVDVLVNNAGMSPVYGKQTDVTEKMFDAVVNLNLKSPFRLSALIGERMVAAGRGSIINVSTHGSLRPHPSFIPYAASKAGLNVMTEALAQAYGPTVRVNTLMPGPFLTDISKAWNFGEADNPFGAAALRRAGNPPEIVGAALFLISDTSSFTTGSIVRADGGSV